MTTETTDFADFTEIFSFCRSLCRWFCCFFCVLFFFSCSSQSVIWFGPLFLLLMFVFFYFLCFFLLRLSVIHLVIFCLNFFHWQRTTLLLFGGGVIIVLHHLGGFFKSNPLSFCSNPVFVFRTKLFHRNRFQLFINCDFTNTFVVSTETADFTESTDLCWKPHQYLQV